MEEPSEVRYPAFYAEKLRRLPPAQSEQNDEVAFWKKRSKEYEDIILRLVTEQASTKFNLIEINEKHIIFKKSQPERKKGKWVEYNGDWLKTMCKCSECGAMIDINEKYKNFFCYHCGARMDDEQV